MRCGHGAPRVPSATRVCPRVTASPPPPDANASIPENGSSAPFGRTEGGCGAGEGCVGGSLCVCECVCVSAHVRAPPFPLQPGEVSRAAGSGAGLGVRACTRVLAQFAHAEPCVPSAVHPPPPLHSYTRTTLTHTHHPCTPLCGPAARRGGVAGGAERRGTQPRGVQTAGCEPAGRKPPCR